MLKSKPLEKEGGALALRRLLAIADCDTLDKSVLEFVRPAFVADDDQMDLPLAPVSRYAELAAMDKSKYYLRVDPVSIKPDIHNTFLFDSAHFEISDAEADALILAFNAHFDEYRIEKAAADRWYMAMDNAPDLLSSSLSTLAGSAVRPDDLQGRDAGHWHSLLNETQMLFFNHPVNQQREANGQMPINSIWPYGGGFLPELKARSGLVLVSDAVFYKGIALLAQADIFNELNAYPKIVHASSQIEDIVLIGSSADFSDLDVLEKQWFSPLLKSLRDGDIAEINFFLGEGKHYRIVRKHLWRFWRR